MKLKELLKKLGLSAKHIETVTTPDADFDVDEVAGEATSNIQQALENDEAFIGKLKGNWQGEVLSSKERYLMKASNGMLTQAEIDALPKQDRFNKVVDLLVTKLSSSKPVSDDKDKEIERLNKLVQERENELRTVREEELPKAQRQAQEVAANFHLRESILKAVQATGKKTVLPVDKTVDLLYADALSAYDLKWDETSKAPKVLQKGKDLLAYSEKDRSKPLSVSDIVPSIGEAQGYFVRNNAPDEGDKTGDRKTTATKKSDGAPRFNLPGLKKAEEHMAEKASAK